MPDKYPNFYDLSHEREPGGDHMPVEEFHAKMENKFDRLEEKYWQCRDHLEHVELKTRLEQAVKLGQSVYLMAKYANIEELINLDDKTQRLVKNTLVEPMSDYPIYDEEIDQAFERGISKGTDDILSILAPDEDFKDAYFLRWRLDLLRLKVGDDLRILDSGYASLSMPTTLPNIEIDYFYSPSSDLPQRAIYYKNQD